MTKQAIYIRKEPIEGQTISDIMISEKTARMMYLKNREKIIQHKRGSFIANFYNNCDVKIINSELQDDKAEFGFKLPHTLTHETLNAMFAEALTNYLKYGKKST